MNWIKCFTRVRNALLLTVIAISLVTITACGSDGPPPMRPTLPASDGRNVKSVSHLGNVLTGYDWSFSYHDGRLISASGVLRDADESIDKSYSYNSYIDYGPQEIWVRNSGGEKTSVALNSLGYIERMTVNRNIYEFFYSDGRLAGWNKIVFEDSFGQATQYKSNAKIEYLDGDLSKITFVEGSNAPIELLFTPSNLMNRNGLLPETVSKEMGCLGFEHLYYAGLLGRPTAHLVKSVNVHHTVAPELDYTTQFEYSEKGGNIVLCSYHTPDNRLATVSYGY